jgi:hypothetical protein
MASQPGDLRFVTSLSFYRTGSHTFHIKTLHEDEQNRYRDGDQYAARGKRHEQRVGGCADHQDNRTDSGAVRLRHAGTSLVAVRFALYVDDPDELYIIGRTRRHPQRNRHPSRIWSYGRCPKI